MWNWLALATAAVVSAPELVAQSEPELRQYLEGKTVTTKLAMPGDYSRYADRLKDHGTAIRAGEPVTITKIKIKQKLIEDQARKKSRT
jgi:hypothetical protein